MVENLRGGGYGHHPDSVSGFESVEVLWMDMTEEDFRKCKKALAEANIPLHNLRIAIVDPRWSEEDVKKILESNL